MSAKKPKAEDPLSPVTTRLPLDWDRIQDLYRANKLSVREIGSMFGVSHVSILKRAKACEWARDLVQRLTHGRNKSLHDERLPAKARQNKW